MSSPLPADAVQPVQQALAAEHAILWLYGLSTAFGLPSAATTECYFAHRDMRDATQKLLRAAGATPVDPQPAYLPPKPVTDAPSAMAAVTAGENDAAAAWRAVLERTDDAALRKLALDGLTVAAVRGTRWRKAAGATPVAPPFPGA